MGRKSRFSSKALDFAYDRYVGNDKAKAEAFEAELANADVARKIYDLRTKAALTQSGLVFLLTKLDLYSRCVFCKPLPHLVVRPRPLHGAGITMMAHPAFRGVIPKCMSGGV